MIAKLNGRTTAEVNRRAAQLLATARRPVKTITVDNGTEFHGYKEAGFKSICASLAGAANADHITLATIVGEDQQLPAPVPQTRHRRCCRSMLLFALEQEAATSGDTYMCADRTRLGSADLYRVDQFPKPTHRLRRQQ